MSQQENLGGGGAEAHSWLRQCRAKSTGLGGHEPEPLRTGKRQRGGGVYSEAPQAKRRGRRVLFSATAEEYRRRSKESRAAYEKLLGILYRKPAKPLGLAHRTAHKLMAVVKSENTSAAEKRKEVEKLMNWVYGLTDEGWDKVVSDLSDAAAAVNSNSNWDKVVSDLSDAAAAVNSNSNDNDDDDDDSGWWKGMKAQRLDLESIQELPRSFPSGLYPLPWEGCRLTTRPDYQMLHVPGLKPWPLNPGAKIVKISDMPEWAQPAFRGMSQLTRVQSRVYETALFTADNILVCAPAGTGKTNVAVLTILQQIANNGGGSKLKLNKHKKILYLTPRKALVAQVVGHLSNCLQEYGVVVRELTSGNDSRREIEETQIMVTTPEKWDIFLTRKSGGELTDVMQLVKLVIFDEIHYLHDENGGPVLESIVARTVRQNETTTQNRKIRLVGLSAPLSSFHDVASFLGVNVHTGMFHFENTYRPVPLFQWYVGINERVREPLQFMNRICYKKVMDSVKYHHQVIIYVHSSKETAETAWDLRNTALAKDTLGRVLGEDDCTRNILAAHAAELVKSKDLKDLLPDGFAILHAGLDVGDRKIVEWLFSDGYIKVLVSTARLVWDVNLPAHTVIIKGTETYDPEKGAWTELSILDIMRMLGRAGNPKCDSEGEAMIITGPGNLTQYYAGLMNHVFAIESHLVSKLADRLNAEIVLGTVRNAREACCWLGHTYLYVRMIGSAYKYGLEYVLRRDVTLEQRRADLIHTAATILEKKNLIKYDRQNGCFQSTHLGRISF